MVPRGCPELLRWSGFEVMESLDSALSGAPSLCDLPTMRVGQAARCCDWGSRVACPSSEKPHACLPAAAAQACLRRRPLEAVESTGARTFTSAPRVRAGLQAGASGAETSASELGAAGLGTGLGRSAVTFLVSLLALLPPGPSCCVSQRSDVAAVSTASHGHGQRLLAQDSAAESSWVGKNLLEAEAPNRVRGGCPRLGRHLVFLTWWGSRRPPSAPPQAPQPLDLGGVHAGGQLSQQSL